MFIKIADALDRFFWGTTTVTVTNESPTYHKPKIVPVRTGQPLGVVRNDFSPPSKQ